MYELQRGRNKKRFVYLQIGDKIEQMIRNGQYRAGDKLPSIDEFAKTFDVNKLTIVKSLKELHHRGVIYTVPVRGTFVADAPVTTAKINSVGVISMVIEKDNSGYYHLQMLNALRNALSEENISLLQFPSARQLPAKIIKQARESQADAFILLGYFPDSVLKLLLEEFPDKAVLLDYCSRSISIDAVVQDNEIGVYQALEALCPPGRTSRIAVISGSDDQPVTAERMHGVRRIQEANPQLEVHKFHGDYTLNSGRAVMQEILDRKLDVDGIFCMNDEMALGVLSIVNEQRLRLPDDFWLFGYDDVLLASAVNLSTIHSPVSEMVQAATSLLLRRLQQPSAPRIVQNFTPQIIWRQTALPPRN